MKIIQQVYSSEADQVGMSRLARACQAETLHVIDLPYRLSSWGLDHPANVGLWSDEHGQMAAWAVLQTPFWSIDTVVSPEIEHVLFPQMLAWADQRARQLTGSLYGHPAWFVNVFSDQLMRREALEQAGFTDQAHAGVDAWSKVWMERDGREEVPGYPLPKGFSMRPLSGEAEVEAYVDLHQSVFESKNMTTSWRRRILHHPDYRPELDVVVTDPAGRLAAFCIGWIARTAAGGTVGQVEPLGCHAEFRSYALGRLALCEVLRRLRQQGAEKIYVETDNYRDTAFRLYQSLGFRVVREVRVYRKDYL